MIDLHALVPLALVGASLALAGTDGLDDAAPTPYEASTPRSQVLVTGTVGDESLDVSANRARFSALMRQVARQTHRELVGIDLLSRDPEVTAKLSGADLRDGLRWIGGSVGLHVVLTTSQIRVTEDLPPYPTRTELYARAGTGYFRALVDHPQSPLAPGALWNRAQIEAASSERGLDAAGAFDELIDRHPTSDLVPTALLEAGQLYGRAGEWEEAAARFDRLSAVLPANHDLEHTARRLLADAYTRLAEESTNALGREEYAIRALHVVDALDDIYPTQERSERRRRYIVRSRANSLANRPVDAMKCIDLATSYSVEGDRDPELAELRALAFDRAQRYGDAIRAWLFHATLVEGEARGRSFERAAAVANRGAEYVTTITIAKAAEADGFRDRIAPYADEALVALDMEPQHLDLFGDPERITRGERLLRKGLTAESARALRSVFDRRATLPDRERLRLARTFARALAKEQRIEDAMTVLRKTAAESQRPSHRRELYLLAADLLESAGELERAIQALEGQL